MQVLRSVAAVTTLLLFRLLPHVTAVALALLILRATAMVATVAADYKVTAVKE